MYDMVTSSNGNIFRVTGHLCGEFTGPDEVPAQRPVTRSFDVFFVLRLNNDWVNNREAGDLRRNRAHYDVIVMELWARSTYQGHGQVITSHRYCGMKLFVPVLDTCFWHTSPFIVRRAGLLWSQRDFEWRWSVPLFKCLTVLEFSFILFDLCLLITFFNFIMNYVPIVTFWIFTYHKIWILSIMFCSIWSYWIIYFLACLEVSWRVVS